MLCMIKYNVMWTKSGMHIAVILEGIFRRLVSTSNSHLNNGLVGYHHLCLLCPCTASWGTHFGETYLVCPVALQLVTVADNTSILSRKS